MLPYELTSLAEQDLKEIARYTLTKWGKKQSLHYARLLEKRFLEIAEGAAFSRTFSTRYPQVRVSRCEHHYIFSFILKKSDLVSLLIYTNEWILLTDLKTGWINAEVMPPS